MSLMRPQLQTLLDESERQLQLAGALGQRILGRHMELEKRINSLTGYERRNPSHTSDSEWDPEMHHNLQDLAMATETWEAENEQAWDDYDQNPPQTSLMPSASATRSHHRDIPGDLSMEIPVASSSSAGHGSRRGKNTASEEDEAKFAYDTGTALLTEVRRLQSLLGERDKGITEMEAKKDNDSLGSGSRQQKVLLNKFNNTNMQPPQRSVPSALQNTLRLISKITVDEIDSAERCGGGGFGDIYVLSHAVIGKLALKRVRISGDQQQFDSQMRRSTREAETWRRLDHPNILPFLEVLERSGFIYLVSPFVQNGSISDFIRRYPDADRARLIQEAAAGIAYLHRCGIIHGDIKGANILVSDDVRALLCDFGLARSQQINTSTDVQGIGTLRWQSPELLESGAGKSFKSDVWAFGMTIYEVLSGYVPFHQYDSATAVIMAVFFRKERPPSEPTTSPAGVSYVPLWEVPQDCWHEDPDRRLGIQDAHDRLILGGFRSLLLSPSPTDAEGEPNDAKGAPSSTSLLSFNPLDACSIIT